MKKTSKEKHTENWVKFSRNGLWYYVSDQGNVKNTAGVVLAQHISQDGYLMVTLGVKKKRGLFSVHRLVALHHLPISTRNETVNHLDRDKTNNHVSNLEWCSRKDNVRHALATACIGTPKEGCVQLYFPRVSAGNNNGFHSSHISKVCEGKRKTHKRYTWRYV